MHTIIHALDLRPPRETANDSVGLETYRQPNYDCQDQAAMMQLIIYVPGVEADGVEIEAQGTDLTITAKKAQVVRANWRALHLERAQRPYRLRLRLGTSFDYAAMHAEIAEGVLTVTLPKRVRHETRPAAAPKRMAA